MSGPIRGLHDVEGQLFAVSGQTLYRITNQGVAIPLGVIPGVGRVSMAHNQVAGGHQLTIVNGVGGYVWNTADQTFTIITDEGYPGSSRVDFIDGYMMHVEPFGRFLLHSDLADALDFNTLDRFEAETQPDKTVSLIVNGSEVWAFGERTIDVFANVGTAQGTFQNKKVGITTGCIAAATPAVVDAGAAWLGDDRVVYHARGYSPTRISTRALEVELSRYSLTDIRNAFSFVYADRGHTIYYLTIPNGMTFGYDFSTGLWHRRSSWHPEKDIYGRWCLSDLVRSNGRWIGGDYRTGKLYVLDWDYPLEGCDPLIRERTTPVAHNDGARFTLDEVELLFDTGGPEVECVPFPYQPLGPQISGEAPDGLTSDPYTFTYTVTSGSSPIARIELRDTTLPSGWEWDDQTATISHDDTPVAKGVIALQMRVYDVNGLFADHEDDFAIVGDYTIVITGKGEVDGDAVFATANTMRTAGGFEFEPIPLDTGADTSGAVITYHDGAFYAASAGQIRYSSDPLVSWDSGSIYFSESMRGIIPGGDGWMVISDDSRITYDLDTPPVDLDGATVTVDWPPGGPGATIVRGYLLMVGNAGGYWWGDINGSGSGILLRSETIQSPSWTAVAGAYPYNIRAFVDVVEFDGALYALVHIALNKTHVQVRKSEDGGATWDEVVLSVVNNGTNPLPVQLCAKDDCLIAVANGGTHVYTSADDFAEAHATGMAHASWPVGRIVVADDSRFYIIGRDSDTTANAQMVSTWDGRTFTDPADVPLQQARSIAVSYDPDVDEEEE